MREVVIVSAARLPTGRLLGALRTLSAPALGALAIREAVRRAGIDPHLVEECIMGQVVTAGAGQAPARQAALRGGLGDHVAALTINKVCGSGLKAVMLGAQAIATGDAEVVVAGGMESMSGAPYLLQRAREGLRMGNAPLLDAMIVDGLWCTFESCHMGETAEAAAVEHGVSRAAQDAYAASSHRTAAAAPDAGWFTPELLPVQVPQKKGHPVVFDRDESIRPATSIETLGTLRPAFTPEGSVTAGNAPPVNDGAAALVLMSGARAAALGVPPLARLVGQATSGLAPKQVLMTPADAIGRLLEKVGWRQDEVDLFEINEAFSVQMVALMARLDLDPARVNIHGGAIALGHPIGASGARILTTLLYALQRVSARRGVASLCLGGGNGVAVAVERI